MRFVYHTLTVVALAVAGGLAHSYFMPIRPTFGIDRPDGTGRPDDQQATGQQPDAPPVAPDAPIDVDALGPFITVPEAHAAWQAANVEFSHIIAFLDARYPDLYEAGHITTARRVLANEFSTGAAAGTIAWLNDEQPDMIIIYCEGGECDASKNLAQQLELLGYAPNSLHVLDAGYEAWAIAHPDIVTQGPLPGAAP